jgi:hypothetical protein
MSSRPVTVFVIIVLVAGALSAPHARSQDIAEAARKAKEAKQAKDGKGQKPSETDNPPAKKTFTSDDFPDSTSSAAPAKPGPPTSKDSATVTLKLAKSSTPRPGGTDVFWTVVNNSDHTMNLTMNLVVTGPCGFRQEHPLRFTINPGYKRGDMTSLGTAIYQDNCPGEYTFELSAISNRQVLDSATATLKVY